jgi:hypothetical protein
MDVWRRRKEKVFIGFLIIVYFLTMNAYQKDSLKNNGDG